MTVPASRTVAVPGLLLRALLAGTSCALLLSAVAAAPSGRATTGSLLAGLALVAWVTSSPASPAPSAMLLLALVVVLDTGPAPGPLLVVQAALLSGVHLLASLCSLAPRDAQWEPAALAPVLRRWLAAQSVCLPVVLAAQLVPGGRLGQGLDVAAGLLSLALVAGLLALALRRRAR